MIVHQIHPVVELHVVDRAIHRQRQGVVPVQRIARRAADGLADHIARGADIALLAIFFGQLADGPDALLLGAIVVDKVFVQRTHVALPGGVDGHMKTPRHLARAVEHNAHRGEPSVEILLEIERGRLTPISQRRDAGAARQQTDAQHRGQQPAATKRHPGVQSRFERHGKTLHSGSKRGRA